MNHHPLYRLFHLDSVGFPIKAPCQKHGCRGQCQNQTQQEPCRRSLDREHSQSADRGNCQDKAVCHHRSNHIAKALYSRRKAFGKKRRALGQAETVPSQRRLQEMLLLQIKQHKNETSESVGQCACQTQPEGSRIKNRAGDIVAYPVCYQNHPG